MNADVDLIFYDTTSLHFEINDEDEDPQTEATAPTYRCASAATRRTGAMTLCRSSSDSP